MNRVVLGIIFCLGGLILLDRNHWSLGLAAFAVGIIVMMVANRRN